MKPALALRPFLIGSALPASLNSTVATATPAAGLRNVVMIMAADLGWSDVAACRLRQGLPAPVATPNIDRLVTGGMMFTDAHSPCSLCAPTRFAMMTGSLPFRMGKRYGTWQFTEAIDAFAPTSAQAGVAHSFVTSRSTDKAFFRVRMEWAPPAH